MAEDGLGLEDLEKWQREHYLGKEVVEMMLPPNFPLDKHRIIRFCMGISDDNPLYSDPEYGPKTRWKGQIAPPTIIISFKYPHAHVGVWDKPFRVLNFVAGFSGEWVDVFRAGDCYSTNLVLKDLVTKHGSKGDLLLMITEGGCWNQDGKLICKQNGTQIQVGAGVDAHDAQKSGTLLYQRTEPYKYSDKEVEDIANAYDDELKRGVRGSKTLYWEDVNEGDKLPKIVRGPLTMLDQIAYKACGFGISWGAFKLGYRMAKLSKEGKLMGKGPEATLTNPATNWPYESDESVHNDLFIVAARGLPLPFDYGAQREQMSQTVINNWMGDDAFIRRLSVQMRKVNQYGDTTWFAGEVVKKYKVTEGGVEYSAVDIRIDGTNQLGEMSTPGTATVYLPSPGREVTVPIPVKDDVLRATD